MLHAVAAIKGDRETDGQVSLSEVEESQTCSKESRKNSGKAGRSVSIVRGRGGSGMEPQ